MALLISGLAIFFLVHLLPTQPELRASLVGRLGANAYRGLFSLVSAAGLALIVVGYGQMQGLGGGNPQLWTPPGWARHVVFLLMLPAIVLLVAAYVPSRIRTTVSHPMLTALMIWAFAHLLANGDLASVLLFGSFLAYALYDRLSVISRASPGPLGTAPGRPFYDVVAVVAGLAVYGLLLVRAHAWLTGVPLLP
jgi:uncharacterized membrane protein